MPRTLSTPNDRRLEVDAAAVEVFADRGFYATTTSQVAAAAGISQAYLYKLYPDKTALFIAALDHCSERLAALVGNALGHAGADPGDVLRTAVSEISQDQALMRFLLHAVCAAAEPGIEGAVRRCYAKQYEVIRSRSSLADEEIRRYFADSMLANVVQSIGASGLPDPWARALTKPG